MLPIEPTYSVVSPHRAMWTKSGVFYSGGVGRGGGGVAFGTQRKVCN